MVWLINPKHMIRLYSCEYYIDSVLHKYDIYPMHTCAATGKVIGLGVSIYVVIYVAKILKTKGLSTLGII